MSASDAPTASNANGGAGGVSPGVSGRAAQLDFVIEQQRKWEEQRAKEDRLEPLPASVVTEFFECIKASNTGRMGEMLEQDRLERQRIAELQMQRINQAKRKQQQQQQHSLYQSRPTPPVLPPVSSASAAESPFGAGQEAPLPSSSLSSSLSSSSTSPSTSSSSPLPPLATPRSAISLALGSGQRKTFKTKQDPEPVLPQSLVASSLPDIPKGKPLYYAVTLDNMDCVRLLLDYGASMEVSMPGFLPPLHVAYTPHMIRLLVSRGANVNFTDSIGRTPLHCLQKSFAKRQLLACPGVDVNCQDFLGRTPLHCASIEAIEMLLEAGARMDIPDAEGMLPVDSIYRTKVRPELYFLLKSGSPLPKDMEDADALDKLAVALVDPSLTLDDLLELFPFPARPQAATPAPTATTATATTAGVAQETPPALLTSSVPSSPRSLSSSSLSSSPFGSSLSLSSAHTDRTSFAPIQPHNDSSHAGASPRHPHPHPHPLESPSPASSHVRPRSSSSASSTSSASSLSSSPAPSPTPLSGAASLATAGESAPIAIPAPHRSPSSSPSLSAMLSSSPSTLVPTPTKRGFPELTKATHALTLVVLSQKVPLLEAVLLAMPSFEQYRDTVRLHVAQVAARLNCHAVLEWLCSPSNTLLPLSCELEWRAALLGAVNGDRAAVLDYLFPAFVRWCSSSTAGLDDARAQDVVTLCLSNAIHTAVSRFSLRALQTLVTMASTGFESRFSAALNLLDDDKEAPLHAAVTYRVLDALAILLSSAHLQVSVADCKGRTALHRAAAIGWSDGLVLLLRAGADANGTWSGVS